MLTQKQIDKVDVIAHSEGGIIATITALLEPEKIRNIVLVDSAGLLNYPTLIQLALRFVKMHSLDLKRLATDKASRKALSTYLWEGTKFLAKNPVRGIKEGAANAKPDIHEWLKVLHDSGSGISVIHGVDDPLFPMPEVQKATKSEEIDGFYSVKGDHNELHLQPHKYTATAVNALYALANRQT